MEPRPWPWKKKSSEKTSSLSSCDQEVENLRNQSQQHSPTKEAISGGSRCQSPAMPESEAWKKVDFDGGNGAKMVDFSAAKEASLEYELEGLKQKVCMLTDENYGLNQHLVEAAEIVKELRREKMKVEENLGVFMNRLDSKKFHKISTCVLEKDLEYLGSNNPFLDENEEVNMGKGGASDPQPSSNMMLLNNVGLDLMDDFLEMERRTKLEDEIDTNNNIEQKLNSAASTNITSITHIVDLENSVSALQFEVVKLNSQNKFLEDQFEKQRMMNEDLHGQLAMSKLELSESYQKNNYLEVALEDKTNCCEELETTCLELQLQLESVVSIENLKSKFDEWQKKYTSNRDISIGAFQKNTLKLAECQRTICNIGKKLQDLSRPGEVELFERLMTFSAAANPTVIKQNKTLREQLASEGCIKMHRRRERHHRKKEILEKALEPSSTTPTPPTLDQEPKQPILRATSPIEGLHYMHDSTIKIDGGDDNNDYKEKIYVHPEAFQESTTDRSDHKHCTDEDKKNEKSQGMLWKKKILLRK